VIQAMRLLLAVVLLAGAGHADVIRVPQDYLNIQVAVNNASDGDTILIAAGDHLGPVDINDKALTLIADGGPARCPQIKVHDLSVGKTVLIRGLGADGKFFTQFGPNEEALLLNDNAGQVRLEDATFLGSSGRNFWNPPGGFPPNHHPDGFDAAIVTDCASVVFTRCTLKGGGGASVDNEDTQSWAGRGGLGLLAARSDVSATSCVLWGAVGGYIGDTLTYSGGDGGDGAHVSDGRYLIADSVLHGANGGSADCDFFSCGFGGSGGDGLELGDFSSNPTELWRHGNTYTHGTGGQDGDGQGFGADGFDVRTHPGAVDAVFPDPLRRFSVTTPLREGGVGSMQFDAEPGDSAFVWASVAPRWTPLPAYQGVFLIDNGPVFNTFVALGPTDALGNLSVPFLAPSLGPFEAATFHLQGIVQDEGGQFLLGPTSGLVILDSSF